MQDILASTKGNALLESVTVGDLFRMIESANDSRGRTAEALGIVINMLGVMTSGHTVPGKPKFSDILAAYLGTLEGSKKVAVVHAITAAMLEISAESRQ